MMLASRRIGIVLIASLLCGRAAAASSEWSITPSVGVTTRTETGFIDLDAAGSTRKAAIAVAAAWHMTRWLGVEAEVAMMPGFFDGAAGLVASSRVTTLSGNVLIHPWQARGIRPYATVGIGAASVSITDVANVFNTRATLGAINGGIGTEVALGARFALRGEARYFRTQFQDPPPGTAGAGERFLHFWRASAGVVFRLD